jgi:subtilisin family serine protease
VTIASGTPGSSPSVQVASDPEAFVVELRGAPLARGRAGRRAADARGALAAQRRRAADAVFQLAAGANRGAARGAVIRHEYDVAFHGFAARIPAGLLDRVRALPDVAAVHPDVELRVDLAQSVPLVGAPQVWSALGYRGAGITIAVLDTGIDHAHADLGGCFGGACKVGGGYDFVNGDATPNDDNGHGTHVASTAAGAGAVPGVAPDARLLAYKVCGSDGTCATSAVLAGLERAIDPNDDGDPSDHAEVINLSLGGPGHPDDPLSQAVDSATTAGALVVASAGNVSGWFRVGSPASARTALTVGATDDADAIAVFSSSGPSPHDLGIKPEMVAPGMAVCAARASGTTAGATCTDTTHVALNGTSMAAPHVSGAAALLAGLQPAATPAELKSLLVNSALDLGLSPFTQGAGRLDVVAAAAARTAVTPAVLGFGLDDRSQPTFTASRTLTLRNLGSTSESYTIDALGMPAGAIVTAAPSSLVLAPGEAASVEVELFVDNAQVPDLTQPPHAYTGALHVVSGSQTQRVPIAFLKGNVLRVHFDVAPNYVVLHNRIATFYVPVAGATTHHVFVPNGTYDVIARFDPPATGGPPAAWVFREGIAVAGSTDVALSASEAVHTVDLLLRDQDDQLLIPTGRGTRFEYRGTSLIVMAAMLHGQPDVDAASFRSSPVSSAYDVGIVAFSTGERPADYVVGAEFGDGIAGDRHFGNTAAELIRARIDFRPTLGQTEWESRGFCIDGAWSYYQCLGTGQQSVPLFDHDVYLRATPALPFPFWFKSQLRALGTTWPQRPTSHVQGGTVPGTVDVFVPFERVTAFYTAVDGEVPVGLGPVSWLKHFGNGATLIQILTAQGTLSESFTDQAGHPAGGPVPWSLYSGAELVETGDLAASNGMLYRPAMLARPYTFVADSPPYLVGGLTGQAHVQADFDLTRVDRNPPLLLGVRLRRGAGITDTLTQGTGGGILELEVRDVGIATLASVTATSGSPPVPLTLTQVAPDTYQAPIADCTPGGVPVTIVAADTSGNSLRQELAPAFACVEPPPPPCPAGSTGFLSPSAQSADTGGDGNGFQTTPTNAFADGGGYARNADGPNDRHRFFDYGIAVPAACSVKGIEVRMDWWLDSTAAASSQRIELSADGGATWTAAKIDAVESTSEHTAVLGSPTDTWGRSWTAAELANAAFRVRVTSISTNNKRDFFLDWLPVRVTYGP